MNRSINTIDNYRQHLKEPVEIVVNNYLDILNEYITFAMSNIHIQKPAYFKYVIIKGLETIQYVFYMLLLYTKNLELVHYHCCKAFYYYIEFIGQVGDDNHVFLRLTSKDAILFVYKKTIFEINDGFKRTFENPINDEKDVFDTINTCVDIINSTVITSLHKCVLKSSAERNNQYIDVTSVLIKAYSKLLPGTDRQTIYNLFNVLYHFNDKILSSFDSGHHYAHAICYFSKKISKKYISPDTLSIKHLEIEQNTDIDTINKNINTLFE